MITTQSISGRERFETLRLRVCNIGTAGDLWHESMSKHDHDRLGNDFTKAYDTHGPLGIWTELRGVTRQRAVLEIAEETGFLTDKQSKNLLREIGELVTTEEELSAAIASGDLVIVEDLREAYFRREKIGVAWSKRTVLWAFFSKLVRNRKAGTLTDVLSFEGKKHRDYIRDNKNKLISCPGFPDVLADYVRNVGLGTIDLDLPRREIRIFECVTEDFLREWLP